MKIVGRITVILAAALVVVGLALGLAQTPYLQNRPPNRGGFEQQRLTSATASSNTGSSSTGNVTNPNQRLNRGGASGGFERTRGRSGNLFAIVSVIQSFAIISLIVALVVFAPRLWQGRRSSVTTDP